MLCEQHSEDNSKVKMFKKLSGKLYGHTFRNDMEMKSTKKLTTYWIRQGAATFRSRYLVPSVCCLQSGVIQSDQKVSVHLMITIQKDTSNDRSVPRQTFIETPNCVLEDRVQYSTVHIPNVFCDDHLQIINFVGIVQIHWVFLYCNHQVHRDFLITLYKPALQSHYRTNRPVFRLQRLLARHCRHFSKSTTSIFGVCHNPFHYNPKLRCTEIVSYEPHAWLLKKQLFKQLVSVSVDPLYTCSELFIQLLFCLRIRTLIIAILLIYFLRLFSISSSLLQVSCTSWIN
jgi:hypothetical protein